MIEPEELLTPLTYDEAKQTQYDALAMVGVSTTGWKPGFVVRTMIASVAVLMVVFSTLITLIGKSGFLKFARGIWLTFVARYVYGIEREAATFATGFVTLNNSAGGGLYELQPGDLILINPDTEKTYRNTTTITLDPGEVLPDVPIVAIEAGSASTSTQFTIVEFQTPLEDVTVTNPLAVVGFDEQTDEELRTACRAVLAARSANGPQDAYAAAVRRAKLPDGTAIDATRIRVRKDGKGNVYVYVAKASGVVSGVVSDINTELGAINDEVQRTACPLGVTAHVIAASAFLIVPDYTMYLTDKQGNTDQQIDALVQKALVEYFAKVPIGGYVIAGFQGKVYIDDMRKAMKVLSTVFRITLIENDDIALLPYQFPLLGTTDYMISLQKQVEL